MFARFIGVMIFILFPVLYDHAERNRALVSQTSSRYNAHMAQPVPLSLTFKRCIQRVYKLEANMPIIVLQAPLLTSVIRSINI